ncbi:hypothetical protein A0H76_2656 [Hepatospora eriocheir]|uniref:Uncharacterized protein n=1 Tax=Hepatospora eriocheir TaxID=1081669 RepID=A0A1X0QJQ9_9MICR|nr:hypothetical protein A0H76_2656 [Hepatospora eriocheir]
MLNNKKDDQTPEEYWKAVSQQLSTRKYEDNIKSSIETLNFSKLADRFKKINDEGKSKDRTAYLYEGVKLKDAAAYYHTAINNSYNFRPIFDLLKPNYTPRISVKTPSFFPKTTLNEFNNHFFIRNLT